MRFALILSLLVAIIAVVFAFQNPEQVDVEFLTFQSVPVPLALVIIVSLLVGVLLGSVGSIPSRLRARGQIKTLKRQLAERDAPPAAAKPTPVVDTHPPALSNAPAASGGAAETERIAAETRRMAEDAQRRAAEAERRADGNL
ncbi:MAG: LapA family protein [Bacteroidota bacterium]